MPLTKEELEYARRLLGREPRREELVVLEAVWSEHCSYKSSKRLLKLLPSRAPHVVVGPGRDAAVVEVWPGFYAAFRIESHNHPSAVDPYNGAATGVGGIVRDILSVGAKPIALLDILYLGEPGDERGEWLARGIVRGISDYGNRIGVPTVAGETWRLPWYNRYPLVNVACIGILRSWELLEGRVEPGDPIVIAGSPTGRDGLLGSSFASKPLEEDIAAVQVGNPFIEKLLIDAIREAVERGLLRHVKDLGGGGLPVAIGETAYASGVGADVELSKLHLREPDMSPAEILASESQERMLLVPKPGRLEELLETLEKHGLEYSVIGVFTRERVVRFRFHGDVVAELPLEVFAGPPEPPRASRRPPSEDSGFTLPDEPRDYNSVLERLVSSPNVSWKGWVFERYDWGVQGRTALPPGYGDAAVLWVYEAGGRRGLAVAGDGNPRYTRLDPWRGAALALEEAYRNVATVGAVPLAAVDNINAGNPEKPEHYWFFEQMVKGLAWCASELGIPVVGGNVSLYNEDPELGMVNPVTSVVVLGRVDDVEFVNQAGMVEGVLLLLGDTLPELGGSEYLHVVHGIVAGEPPAPRPSMEVRLARLLHRLTEMGVVKAAHDISNGGLATAIAEMVALGEVGVRVELERVLCRGCRRLDELLFSESQARVLIVVDEAVTPIVERLAAEHNVPVYKLGVAGGDRLVATIGSRRVIDVTVDDVRSWFRGGG